ncbi:MAG: hypothetical protein JSU98_16310 [Gemmatimonadales bacterium]|nr:MAG: hypothetical protein JSU98_16310 [Gemmatimonadales bacterium]
MRIPATLLTLLLVAACGGGEEGAPEMPEAAGPMVADFAGNWQTMAMLEGTPDPVPSTLAGSADGSEWTMTLEGRDPVPLTASIVGDSLVLVSDPYESVLREGVMVTIRTAGVLQEDGRMMGTLVATYQTPEGEQVVSGTFESTMQGGM